MPGEYQVSQDMLGVTAKCRVGLYPLRAIAGGVDLPADAPRVSKVRRTGACYRHMTLPL